MTRTVRAVAAAATFVLAIVLPRPLPAQSLMFRPKTPDITAHLPPVTSVPWLDQKTPVKQQKPKIEAGSLTAWFWVPATRPAWPTHQAQVVSEAEPFRM